eukprot:scaffold9781_cov101-Skeletonema_dohrnii-CCMP3373.AAC.1
MLSWTLDPNTHNSQSKGGQGEGRRPRKSEINEIYLHSRYYVKRIELNKSQNVITPLPSVVYAAFCLASLRQRSCTMP